MDISLSEAIKILCPDMSPGAVEEAARILTDYQTPLLQHGHLPTANYDLPPVVVDDRNWKKSSYATAYLTVAMHLELKRAYGGYGALASTEVGLTFPMISMSTGLDIQHPRFEALNGETVTVNEGCGSLGRSFFLAAYPANVRLLFKDSDGRGREFRVEEMRAWWAPITLDYAYVDVKDFMHEAVHLEGRTAADGQLVHPTDVPDEAWLSVAADLVGPMNEDYRQTIPAELYQPPPTVEKGKRAFLAYLQTCLAKVGESPMLIPSNGEKPYGRVFLSEYIKIVEDLV